MRRLLMYSQDGMGLGHLRRSSNIAHQVLLRDPKCDILIIADSPATSLVSSRPGVDILKLPTIVKTGSASWKPGAWKTGSMSSRIERVIDLRARLILDAYQEFRPDTVLVDHMPVGALGELKPMLDRASTRPRTPRLMLGLRDVLDAPSVIRRVWTKLDAYDYLRRYDAVMVYGVRDIYDATAAYGLQPSARLVVYCNYVGPGEGTVRAVSAPQDPYVLMMGGGGRDSFPLAVAFLEAIPDLCRELQIGAMLLTGPNMSPTDRDALVSRAAPEVTIESGYATADEWIRGAALVITLAGYNSLAEVLKWHRKALVVPRPGPSAEQRTRSALFAKRSLIRTLDARELSPSRLAHAMEMLIADDRVPDAAQVPALDGAERAAGILLDGVSSLRGDLVVAAADTASADGASEPERKGADDVVAHGGLAGRSQAIGLQ
jgi:predicted glycosyltransferase